MWSNHCYLKWITSITTDPTVLYWLNPNNTKSNKQHALRIWHHLKENSPNLDWFTCCGLSFQPSLAIKTRTVSDFDEQKMLFFNPLQKTNPKNAAFVAVAKRYHLCSNYFKYKIRTLKGISGPSSCLHKVNIRSHRIPDIFKCALHWIHSFPITSYGRFLTLISKQWGWFLYSV